MSSIGQAWRDATGRRWDRLGTRIATQAAPYRQRAQGRPEQRFCIFAQGRTGSSLLRSLLNTHDAIHCDGELLLDPLLSPVHHVERHARLVDARAYGFKVKIYQLTRHQGLDDPRSFLEALVDRGYDLIHLSRRNLLRHAISNEFASATGKHRYRDDDGTERATITVDPAALIGSMGRREGHARTEEEALAGFDALPLVYEDDLMTPSDQQRTLDRITGMLGLPSVGVDTPMRRSVTGTLRDRIANYDQLAEALVGSGYAHFLDDPAYRAVE